MIRCITLLLPIALALGCRTPVQKRFFSAAELGQRVVAGPEKAGGGNHCCRVYESYTPDTLHLDHVPLKYVKVNVHFMNSADSTRNFNGREGVDYARGILDAAMYDIETNDKLYLPYGNDLPALPPRYRYVLTPRPDDPDDDGIYFHYDDELYYYVVMGQNRNRSSRAVVEKYGVQLDTVLNIFFLPHHPDSVASTTYDPYRCGIALGQAIKIAGGYENSKQFWDIRQVLNHEIAHIYGLTHTWAYNDGCDDTPKNPRCWNRTDTPPCDTAASNNLMDYNAYQNAWSPCQIGKIHYYMANETGRARKFLVPNWCELHDDRHIVIRDSIHWQGAKDLEGNLTVAAGGSLRISCRTSIPRGGKITVQAGGKLILDNCRLHNACGDDWEGIEIQKTAEQEGQVVVIGQPIVENCRSFYMVSP